MFDQFCQSQIDFVECSLKAFNGTPVSIVEIFFGTG
jgi:hypothetical protein